MNKSLSKNSESSNKFESPVPFHTSPRWDAANTQGSPIYWSSEESPAKPFDNSKAIVAVDKFTQYTPEKSTRRQNPPHHSPAVPAPPPPPVMPPQRESKGEWRREEALRKAALGFRVSEVVVCLISFSVMASDRTQGWSGDSFDRYKEYRYCLSVNIIAFAYAGLQAFDLVYQLVTGKHMINHHLRSHFDFFVDQPPGSMIGNRIGGKTSSQRWQVPQLVWHSLVLLPLLLAHLSLGTFFVPAAPCELNNS
nr:CASP-like protein 4A3 isoform X2 [Arachis hypogaea]